MNDYVIIRLYLAGIQPPAEDFTGTNGRTNNETKKRFRDVFDKRKQRIGVLENGDDD
jgi:YLP motif-containing protein 1